MGEKQLDAGILDRALLDNWVREGQMERMAKGFNRTSVITQKDSYKTRV